MKRDWRKAIDNLAQRLVTETMNAEFIDMIRGNRERTPERLEWLEQIGQDKAVQQYSLGNPSPLGLGYFKARALFYAKSYMKTVVKNYEEGK